MDNNLILELKNKIKKRKIIEAIIFVISIIIFIISLYFLKKVNVDILPLLLLIFIISLYFSLTTFILIIYELISKSIKQANSNGDDIIIYRGCFTIKLYVNNELIGTFYTKRSYVEGQIRNGVKITCMQSYFNTYHIVFSDNRNPIDL